MVAAGVVIVGLAALLGPRAADPATAIGARSLVHERGAEAIARLAALQRAIQPGLDAARVAGAAVVSAVDPPGDRITAAAELIIAAEDAALPARRSVADLNGARLAWRPDAVPIPLPLETGELGSIGAQLRAAAPAADAFAQIRLAAEGLAGVLEEAVRALERGDVSEAERLTSLARADHETVAEWETDIPTLPVWLDTTDAMIRSVEDILAATRVGDAEGAAAAAEAFAGLREEAATADRALRITLAEGGSALTATPLQRLAAVLSGIEEVRAAAEAAIAEAGT
jgi:hypothetical protein